MSEWQPIETAPKTHPILVWLDDEEFCVLALWRLPPGINDPDEPPCWWSTNMDMAVEPSHWMPLPSPPTTGEKS